MTDTTPVLMELALLKLELIGLRFLIKTNAVEALYEPIDVLDGLAAMLIEMVTGQPQMEQGLVKAIESSIEGLRQRILSTVSEYQHKLQAVA